MQDHHKLRGLWILLALTLASAFFTNVPVSPPYQAQTPATSLVFKTIGSADTILLDDDPTFSSPHLIKKEEAVVLTPGTYYWKTTGVSLVSTFTILSEVALAVEEQADSKYSIINKGNVDTDVEIKQPGLPVGFFVLEKNNEFTLSLEEHTAIVGVESNAP